MGGGEDVESSLSCRSKVVQSLMMNSGYRKIDTLLPTREGLGEEWLEIQRNLRKINRFRVAMVEGSW